MDPIGKLNIPERIEGLAEMAYNLWWSWQPQARNTFKNLDRSIWKSTGHNPVKLLRNIPYFQLVASSKDANYLSTYDKAYAAYKHTCFVPDTWYEKAHPDYARNTVAYFSLEFAVHNSLPLYAGGLGVLAGDYCKEASDSGIPLVGIGFMYPQGYFHQVISQDGWQNEVYSQLNYSDVPLTRLLDADGKLLMVKVPLDSVHVYVSAWVLNLGRNKMYLLDTNLNENPQAYRGLSARLYGGDREMRLLQELVIGLGGVRLLRAIGVNPVVWHANEGHTTFMMVERIRELIEKGVDMQKAIADVKATTVFTTHTPVPAGNDAFSLDLIEKYFHNYWGQLKISKDEFMKFGSMETDRTSFNMTVLGLHLADYRNGVSKLHGQVCRKMWQPLWPREPEDEVPIDHVTNGVHLATWVSPQMQFVYSSYIGEDWLENQADPAIWEKVLSIPDELLWNMHRWRKIKLISTVLDRARQRWTQDKVSPVQPLAMGALLDTEALTIGFCRRFTGYKRPTLIFRDLERLKKLLRKDLRPLQIVFAGKAHPMDEDGKRLIQQVYDYAKDPEFGGRIAFIEDYDMHMARDLVSGVDVWLNTPRFLVEASGTSGQKASANGVLHLSVLDGWWYEGFNGDNGWGIEEKANPDNYEEQDTRTANAVYDILQEQVIPLYYDRDITGTPHGWIKMMKESIRTNTPFFNTKRMARDYAEKYYIKAMERLSKGS
jgi:starch phosphorylase